MVGTDAPRYTIIDVNEVYLAVTMTQRENLGGRGIFEAFPDCQEDVAADRVSNLRASHERVLASRKPAPVLGEHSNVGPIIQHATDVTEVCRTQAKLRESEAAALVDAQRVKLTLAAGAIIGTWV